MTTKRVKVTELTRPIVPPGEVHGRRFEPGAIVEGEVAAFVLEFGQGVEIADDEPAPAARDGAPVKPKAAKAKGPALPLGEG